MKTLTIKFDVYIDDTIETYIPEGTKVKVYQGYQREGSTKIVYNDEVIEYMNCSFVELS